MMKASAYMRVSTADQNPDLQRDGITDFSERAGLRVVAFGHGRELGPHAQRREARDVVDDLCLR